MRHPLVEPQIERAATRWLRRAGLMLTAALCVAIGTGLGLALTHLTTQPDSQIGATRVGPWRYWTDAGRPDINPYLRARYALSGEIPLAAAEGLTATARIDDTGQPLRQACRYRITGPAPVAQFWTLEAASDKGAPLANAAQRYSFTASDVLRESDGQFTISAAAAAQPGNWLPLTGSGSFVLVLRLYGSPLTSNSARDGRVVSFPSIVLDRCP